MSHQDLVIRFPIWACMALVTLVLTQASLGPGYSVPHLDLTLTSDLWSHSGPQTKLVTLVPLWASPLRGDSGHPLGFTWAWGIWSLAGPHMDLGTGRHLGLTWAW